MYINIEDVSVSPQTVNTGSTFLITVKVQLSTYDRLKNFAHGFLAKFTHRQLGQDLIKE